MSVSLKTRSDIENLKLAGKITAGALAAAGKVIKPGVTTKEVDRVVHDYIVSHNAIPSFLNYDGFPASACISVNEEVIHGIPGKRVLKEGDIVSVDVGAKINGFHGDSAYTFCCGNVSEEAQNLLNATKEALKAGILAAQAGNRLGDIGEAIQKYVETRGFGVVRDYVGHGVGRNLHEDPEVPNFGKSGHGLRLVSGMVIAIEPMITAGTFEVEVLSNDWTVVTKDSSLAAHFEHTIAITPNGPIILTTE